MTRALLHRMDAPRSFTLGRAEVRLALRTTGGDLRAVGAMLGLTSEQILMILAFDVQVTRVPTKDTLAPSLQPFEQPSSERASGI